MPTSTISDQLSPYHIHSCHSRQAWVKGMTAPFPCDCGLVAALADFAERITPEKDTRVNAIKGVDEGIQLGFNACVDTITQNVKAELGAVPINSKETK